MPSPQTDVDVAPAVVVVVVSAASRMDQMLYVLDSWRGQRRRQRMARHERGQHDMVA